MSLNYAIPQVTSPRATSQIDATERMQLRAALLTNCIPPYWTATFSNLSDRISDLRIFLSTPMEGNRAWQPDWGDLHVTVQRCWTYTANRRHELGFSDEVWRHIPYDTLPVLIRNGPDVVGFARLGFRTLQAA